MSGNASAHHMMAPVLNDPPATSTPDRRWPHIICPLLLGLIAGAGTAAGAFHYGWSLFLLTPMVVGIAAAWLPRGPCPSLRACLGASVTVNIVLSFLFLLLGVEGLICIVMAAPLVALMGMVGGLLGGLLRRRWERPRVSVYLLLIVVPFLLAWERPQAEINAPIAVTTEVIVRASPEAVWRETIDFAPIIDPPSGILRLGIAYPTHAILRREGNQIIRECHFTTGPFIEPITAWEPPHRLAFDVASQPPSMRELSPWPIHPPHLDGMIRSQRGEFQIEAVGDGLTRLRGTTWYTIEAAPAAYWRLWTDAIIHRIHRRVLDHIARQAERLGQGAPGSAMLPTR